MSAIGRETPTSVVTSTDIFEIKKEGRTYLLKDNVLIDKGWSGKDVIVLAKSENGQLAIDKRGGNLTIKNRLTFVPLDLSNDKKTIRTLTGEYSKISLDEFKQIEESYNKKFKY